MHPSAAAGLRQDFLNDMIGEILLTAESHRSYHLKNLDAAQPRQKDAREGHIQQNEKCIGRVHFQKCILPTQSVFLILGPGFRGHF